MDIAIQISRRGEVTGICDVIVVGGEVERKGDRVLEVKRIEWGGLYRGKRRGSSVVWAVFGGGLRVRSESFAGGIVIAAISTTSSEVGIRDFGLAGRWNHWTLGWDWFSVQMSITSGFSVWYFWDSDWVSDVLGL